MYKKIIAIGLVSCLALSLSAVAFATEFQPSEQHEFAEKQGAFHLFQMFTEEEIEAMSTLSDEEKQACLQEKMEELGIEAPTAPEKREAPEKGEFVKKSASKMHDQFSEMFTQDELDELDALSDDEKQAYVQEKMEELGIEAPQMNDHLKTTIGKMEDKFSELFSDEELEALQALSKEERQSYIQAKMEELDITWPQKEQMHHETSFSMSAGGHNQQGFSKN